MNAGIIMKMKNDSNAAQDIPAIADSGSVVMTFRHWMSGELRRKRKEKTDG